MMSELSVSLSAELIQKDSVDADSVLRASNGTEFFVSLRGEVLDAVATKAHLTFVASIFLPRADLKHH